MRVGCRVLGHRFRFGASGSVLRWRCERCGAYGGERLYPSAALAERYARALERSGRDADRRRPLWSALALRAFGGVGGRARG
jgi:hypothetical protein